MRTKVDLPRWIATETKFRPYTTLCWRISVNYFHRYHGSPRMHQRSIYWKHVVEIKSDLYLTNTLFTTSTTKRNETKPNETKRKKKIEKKTEVSILNLYACWLFGLVWFKNWLVPHSKFSGFSSRGCTVCACIVCVPDWDPLAPPIDDDRWPWCQSKFLFVFIVLLLLTFFLCHWHCDKLFQLVIRSDTLNVLWSQVYRRSSSFST